MIKGNIISRLIHGWRDVLNCNREGCVSSVVAQRVFFTRAQRDAREKSESVPSRTIKTLDTLKDR